MLELEAESTINAERIMRITVAIQFAIRIQYTQFHMLFQSGMTNKTQRRWQFSRL
jgi:hypothetical protein